MHGDDFAFAGVTLDPPETVTARRANASCGILNTSALDAFSIA